MANCPAKAELYLILFYYRFLKDNNTMSCWFAAINTIVANRFVKIPNMLLLAMELN